MNIRSFLPILLSAVTVSCAISQSVDPSDMSADARICIIEDRDVRAGFLEEITRVLDEKKINYQIVDKHQALDCEWTMTYLGRWTWDIAMYMSYAEIRIYRNGLPDGEAVYDASTGAFNLNKFIDAEPKIRELVEELITR